MLQRIWWFWSKGPPYGKREYRAWNQEREKIDFCLGDNARRETCTQIKENLWGFVWCWKEKDKEKKVREERVKFCCDAIF